MWSSNRETWIKLWTKRLLALTSNLKLLTNNKWIINKWITVETWTICTTVAVALRNTDLQHKTQAWTLAQCLRTELNKKPTLIWFQWPEMWMSWTRHHLGGKRAQKLLDKGLLENLWIGKQLRKTCPNNNSGISCQLSPLKSTSRLTTLITTIQLVTIIWDKIWTV